MIDTTNTLLGSFADDGYLFLPAFFDIEELNELHAAIPALLVEETDSRVLEKHGRSTRALHGCHLHNAACDRLTRSPRLLSFAKSILQSDVYIHQFKINTKAAMIGDFWPWHQDYIFWREEDGMPTPNAVNIMVFLDNIDEFNGPLFLIEKSHRHGVIEPALPTAADRQANGAEWRQHVSADLKYQLSRDQIAGLLQSGKMVSPKGPAGSVLIFHSNLVHGSPQNISPFERRVAIITYNSVDNVPTRFTRPAYLVGRDPRPIQIG